jgi:hypothetical protein
LDGFAFGLQNSYSDVKIGDQCIVKELKIVSNLEDAGHYQALYYQKIILL